MYDEEVEVYVTLVVDYQVPNRLGIPYAASYQFVDVAPEFNISQGIINSFRGMKDVCVDVFHDDVPKPIEAYITHYGNGLRQ